MSCTDPNIQLCQTFVILLITTACCDCHWQYVTSHGMCINRDKL